MSDYLDLVVKSGQVNTPPGSHETVKEWIREGFVTTASNVLEIGCSSGFITHEIVRYSGATATGLDLHGGSIGQAKINTDSNIQSV